MASYANVPQNGGNQNEKVSPISTQQGQPQKQSHPYHEHHHLSDMIPGHHGQQQPHQPHQRHFHLPRGIHEDGESGRKGFHPWHFIRISARSSCWPSALVNILWPFVPLAAAFHWSNAYKDSASGHQIRFATAFLAMIPSANLLGFAGQELARKLPKVFGVVLETFLGGIVEIVLFMVLIAKSPYPHDEDSGDQVVEAAGAASELPVSLVGKRAAEAEVGDKSLIPVIQAAILGSVLANLLFCLGLCFVAGGVRHSAQKFSKEISETGSGLLLMAAFALTVPRAFGSSLENAGSVPIEDRIYYITKISRAGGVILIIAYIIYIVFQMFSHHSIISEIFEQDELRDRDREDDLNKDKLTLTECILAIVISLVFVCGAAIFLVLEIEYIVSSDSSGPTDMFVGLILVPLVEKFSEHLTAIDEAWDNTMNLALSHVLGATLQTVLFNTGLVVVVGWGLGKDMNLDFNSFHVIIVVLAILAVGSFLRDGESTYLEGSVCVLIYILIAVAAYYYPNITEADMEGFTDDIDTVASATSEAVAAATTAAAEVASTAAAAAETALKMMMRV